MRAFFSAHGLPCGGLQSSVAPEELGHGGAGLLDGDAVLADVVGHAPAAVVVGAAGDEEALALG